MDWDGFVYILKVPLQIRDTEKDGIPLCIVQVGMVSKGEDKWMTLSDRLYQHRLAWWYITNDMNNGNPTSTKNTSSCEWLKDFDQRRSRFPDLIGLLPRLYQPVENDEGNIEAGDDYILNTEAFVRDLIGTRLRRTQLTTLLTKIVCSSQQPNAWWTAGDLSATELRVISKHECEDISQVFNSSDNMPLHGLVDKVVTWKRHLTEITATLKVNYTTNAPSDAPAAVTRTTVTGEEFKIIVNIHDDDTPAED